MHNNIKQPKAKTNQKVIRDNNVKKCLKCLDVSSYLDASFSPHFPASRSSAGNGVRHLPIRHRWSAGLFSVTRKCSQTPTEWDLHPW